MRVEHAIQRPARRCEHSQPHPPDSSKGWLSRSPASRKLHDAARSAVTVHGLALSQRSSQKISRKGAKAQRRRGNDEESALLILCAFAPLRDPSSLRFVAGPPRERADLHPIDLHHGAGHIDRAACDLGWGPDLPRRCPQEDGKIGRSLVFSSCLPVFLFKSGHYQMSRGASRTDTLLRPVPRPSSSLATTACRPLHLSAGNIMVISALPIHKSADGEQAR